MRMCISQFQIFDDEMAKFALQLGIRDIQMNTPKLPGKGIWDFEALKNLRDRIESYGLKFTMIENIPLTFYDKVMLGLPGRDEQIENYIQTMRNVSSLGIEILGHHFSPSFVWRTDYFAEGRGGAKVSEYQEDVFVKKGNTAMKEIMERKGHLLDYDVLEVLKGVSSDTLFANYKYFMDAIIPVAEELNLKLALHPDDPPVESLNGISRMISGVESYKRAMEIADSPMWGANLCLGTMSELNGAESVKDSIRLLGEAGKLFVVHFRDVKGTLPNFRECFLGEGNFDPAEIMSMLADYGFDGLISEDHVGHMDYDSPYGHRARAHEIGYMKGLINMLNYNSAD